MSLPNILPFDFSHLLDEISRRDAALWLRLSSDDLDPDGVVIELARLPWRMVLLEVPSRKYARGLDQLEDATEPLVRKRGFVQLVTERPSVIELPQRCLPIYLLERAAGGVTTSMPERLRRLEVLDLLRTANLRRVVVISVGYEPVPQELTELWESGLRTYASFVSDEPRANDAVVTWADNITSDDRPIVSLYPASPRDFATMLWEAYVSTYPDDRTIIRIRDGSGETASLDISFLDNPDHPILEDFTTIQEKDLVPLLPEELTAAELEAFFRGSSESWRPYAAGLVWEREVEREFDFNELVQRIDDLGNDENCLAYVSSEAGAGGTTFVRNLAWKCAGQGYPVLIADALPKPPDSLTVSNFMNRVYEEAQISKSQPGSQTPASGTSHRRYDPPWVIVFDRVHWDHHDTELRRFASELRSRGKPACVLVVCGPRRILAHLSPGFRKVGDLTHTLSEDEALALGKHLNRFLAPLGRARSEGQWRSFYRSHTADDLGGLAAFWVVLSFWLTRQLDLSETLQGVLYRTFAQTIQRKDLQKAILYIAAMSVERIPVPNGLLPPSRDDWPIQQHLEDERASLGALGLVRAGRDSRDAGWVLIHDVLGRLLLNAVYQDREKLDDLGLVESQDVTHLRFLLLSEMSRQPELGHVEYRSLGDQFATSIMKIDPDHGRGEFLPLWRDVLNTLDEMPSALRRASRVFLHHTAVSRRRIAKFDSPSLIVSPSERIALLRRVIEDIELALDTIEYRSGSEPDLNLYNSLAHAYMDLAELVDNESDGPAEVPELLKRARDAANRAYDTNPTNSFAIETFVRHLLSDPAEGPQQVLENCTRALGIVFATIASNQESYRQASLDGLAGQAVQRLLENKPDSDTLRSPHSPVDVLLNAWITLFDDVASSEFSLEDLPRANRLRAIDELDHPAGRGNSQVVRLTYELTALTFPLDFHRQLSCLEQLQGVHGSESPQERLEYAILLFEVGRPMDGEKVFAELRRLWRDTDHFVRVPDRLRWLLDDDGSAKVVQAVVRPDGVGRPMGQIQQLRNCRAPFRPEEFGIRGPSVGMRLSCMVSFGYNGPFLRPVTARTT